MTDEIEKARIEFIGQIASGVQFMARQYERHNDPLDIMRAKVLADARDILLREWRIVVMG